METGAWHLEDLHLLSSRLYHPQFFLAPFLVYKKQAGRYFLLSSLLVVVFFFVQYYTRPKPPHHRPRTPIEVYYIRTNSSAAGSLSKANDATATLDTIKVEDELWKPQHHRHFGPSPMIEMFDFLGSVMLIMLLGLNLGVKFYIKQEKEEKIHSELEQRHLQEQLAYLRYQINPHFFMNTLNNIHALIDIDPEKAKSTIVRLSRLMRYMLYESNHILVPLMRELSFLNHYIALMKMRYSEKVVVTVDIPDTLPDCMVPPLLYVTFVENAFKHGVTYEKESFIYIDLNVENERVVFHCTNSKPAKEAQATKPGGVGLTNVRRRLRLIYGSDYMLDINDTNDRYDLRLSLPLHPKQEKELMPEEDGQNKNPKTFKA